MLTKPQIALRHLWIRYFTDWFTPGVLLLTLVGGSGCAVKPYQPEPEQLESITSRAEVQEQGNIQVRVAVASPEETEALFGLPLYERRIQPVWIEVVNGGNSELRFAPVGTDPEYVPPFEVAYTHREGFSGKSRSEMELYLHQLSMQRRIGAGQSGSGFVFTEARPGTKGVAVDLFGPDKDEAYSFLFFVPVPGFEPGHAQVNFAQLFAKSEFKSFNEGGLRQALNDMPCCASGQSGEDFLNVVFIGDGNHVLQALLKAGWFERLAEERSRFRAPSNAAMLYERIPDAVFRKEHPRTGESNELRLWMTPMKLGKDPVWIGDVLHFIKGPEGPVSLDPDVDDARNFLLQSIWYNQSLAKFGWVRGMEPVSIDEQRSDAVGDSYFTDGFRVVIWPSRAPISLLEVEYAEWDRLPETVTSTVDTSAY